MKISKEGRSDVNLLSKELDFSKEGLWRSCDNKFLSIPLRTSPREKFINFILPMTELIMCTEKHCSEIIYAPTLHTAKKYLLCHLSKTHHLENLNCIFWCSTCKVEIAGHILDHKCFSEILYYNIDISLVNLKHRCMLCQYSFNNKADLTSHHKSTHKNKMKKNELSASLTDSNSLAGDTNSSTLTDNGNSNTVHNNSNTHPGTIFNNEHINVNATAKSTINNSTNNNSSNETMNCDNTSTCLAIMPLQAVTVFLPLCGPFNDLGANAFYQMRILELANASNNKNPTQRLQSAVATPGPCTNNNLLTISPISGRLDVTGQHLSNLHQFIRLQSSLHA